MLRSYAKVFLVRTPRQAHLFGTLSLSQFYLVHRSLHSRITLSFYYYSLFLSHTDTLSLSLFICPSILAYPSHKASLALSLSLSLFCSMHALSHAQSHAHALSVLKICSIILWMLLLLAAIHHSAVLQLQKRKTGLTLSHVSLKP